jgi:hypothetical protein
LAVSKKKLPNPEGVIRIKRASDLSRLIDPVHHHQHPSSIIIIIRLLKRPHMAVLPKSEKSMLSW